MSQKMLIDAAHPEETRVVVVEGSKLLDFDFETSQKRQLTGNIYLARVTRVEAALQAAFIEYGGGRHGFLPFNEIHPDYYFIPVQDREPEPDDGDAGDNTPLKGMEIVELDTGSESVAEEDASGGQEEEPGQEDLGEQAESPTPVASDTEDAEPDAPKNARTGKNGSPRKGGRPRGKKRKRKLKRNYKIQEVIRVNQILLVQITKSERGNKGASLTTYLSLAGRYCVLMPNTPRGCGISRKITNPADRKRLKDIAEKLALREGAGLIIRTAGSNRTKQEIHKDYKFLMRQWDEIRNLTLKSKAPAPIFEESDLIRRAVRDTYSKSVTEVFVEGERGYRVAKEFMKMIMPSHARKVKRHKDSQPLFTKHGVESALAEMFNGTVQLPSGGHIVFGLTEALVAVDVNSGKSTRQGNVEQTALTTNLEAAEEIARQLRLRDLGGLVVIDFIDMSEKKNISSVESRFRESCKADKARIQIGRISDFGLMELSRQRMRPGMVESSTVPCQHCDGTGNVRTDNSIALSLLRELEMKACEASGQTLILEAPVLIANYLQNQKRQFLTRLETQNDVNVLVVASAGLESPAYELSNVEAEKEVELQEIVSTANLAQATSTPPTPPKGKQNPRKRRPRRRRRSSRGRGGSTKNARSPDTTSGRTGDGNSAGADTPDKPPEKAKSGKRSGRSRRRKSRKGKASQNRGKQETEKKQKSKSKSKSEKKAKKTGKARPRSKKSRKSEENSSSSAEADHPRGSRESVSSAKSTVNDTRPPSTPPRDEQPDTGNSNTDRANSPEKPRQKRRGWWNAA